VNPLYVALLPGDVPIAQAQQKEAMPA